MTPAPSTSFAALQRLAEAGPDEDLVRRFCAERDEAAFTVLVRRHGGLVLDVCRAVLRNEADAEDAFQATFVALAAQAGRVHRPAALAGWLHAVACRTAAKARRARDRRRVHETRAPARPDLPAHDPSWVEVRQTIHEEVNRLPDRFRAAVVLFYLAGQTQDEVGRALGLSTAGAKKRLERGRALLRSALDRRGFGPAAVLAATTVTASAPSAAVSASAAEMAVRFVTDRATVPAAILSLVSSGVHPMSAKFVVGAALLVGVATTVGLGVLQGGPGEQPGGRGDPPPAGKKKASAPAADPAAKAQAATELDRLRALDPAERLKHLEKLAGGDLPFAAATRGDLGVAVLERGSLEPASYTDLVCKVRAKDRDSAVATTIKWLIEDGTMVKKGDRIAQLDDTWIRDQQQAATLKLKEAEAALAVATENFRLAKEEYDVEIRLAEIDIRVAQADLKEAAAGGKSNEVQLELKVEQAKLKLTRAQARAKAQIARAEAERRAKTAALEVESERLNRIQAELRECELHAPSDGIVIYPVAPAGRFGGPASALAPGENVREGQKLLRLTDLKEMVLAIRVQESMISTVRVGQAAQVRIDAFPEKMLRGKVTQISPIAAASNWQAADVKVYPVLVAIEDPPRGLKPGMSAQAQIPTVDRDSVLQVPLKAVVTVGKDRICFVKSGRELLERKVTTGESSPDAIEIKEGIKEGDLVLTDPRALLVPR